MNYEKELNLIYIILDFYQQETVEVNGEWCISVKGTAEAYGVHIQTIQDQLDNNENNFKDHIDTTKAFQKKFGMLFSLKDRMAPKKQWLDKFAFLEIGTLLRSSPKTICFLNNKWVPFVEVDEAQIYYLVDKKGKFFITLEQNAIASGSKYDSDSPVFNKLRK